MRPHLRKTRSHFSVFECVHVKILFAFSVFRSSFSVFAIAFSINEISFSAFVNRIPVLAIANLVGWVEVWSYSDERSISLMATGDRLSFQAILPFRWLWSVL